jgi:hypothetical protein
MFMLGSFLTLLRLKKKSVVKNANETIPHDDTLREVYRQDRERRRRWAGYGGNLTNGSRRSSGHR